MASYEGINQIFKRGIEAGTSTEPVKVSTANLKHLSFYLENAATSGDNRLLYMKQAFTGAGGGGECLRAWQVIDDVSCGTARGAHISLSFDASGSITGLGTAVSATLHIPNATMASGGTYAPVEAQIYSDGASSTPSGVTQLSFIRATAGGNATGIGAVDDKAYFLVLDGLTTGAGNVVVASATEANYVEAARCLLNGTERWLMFASASG